MDRAKLTIKDLVLLVTIVLGAAGMGLKLGEVKTEVAELKGAVADLKTTIEHIAPRPSIGRGPVQTAVAQ